MRHPVTKKYAKAFINTFGIKNVSSSLEGFFLLKKAFNNNHFVDSISVKEVPDNKKKELIKYVSGLKDKNFSRFLDILFLENRVFILADLYDYLNEYISLEQKEYKATISSNIKLDKNIINDIKKKLDKKINAKVTINNNLDKSFDGIKVYVDILNVEISLSREGIKRKLSEMILKQL